ncbi:unnamed protein product, partial [Mesorhabditis spiculigera]
MAVHLARRDVERRNDVALRNLDVDVEATHNEPADPRPRTATTMTTATSDQHQRSATAASDRSRAGDRFPAAGSASTEFPITRAKARTAPDTRPGKHQRQESPGEARWSGGLERRGNGLVILYPQCVAQPTSAPGPPQLSRMLSGCRALPAAHRSTALRPNVVQQRDTAHHGRQNQQGRPQRSKNGQSPKMTARQYRGRIGTPNRMHSSVLIAAVFKLSGFQRGNRRFGSHEFPSIATTARWPASPPKGAMTTAPPISARKVNPYPGSRAEPGLPVLGVSRGSESRVTQNCTRPLGPFTRSTNLVAVPEFFEILQHRNLVQD